MSAPEADRKKPHRSPAYPIYNLEKALEYVATIYKHEKRTAVPVAVIADHCGTDIKSSKGLRLISALKQFGLVIEIGSGDDRQVKLSDRALDIVLAESEDSPERLKAISDAALSPPTHRKVWDHFRGELPSDATLQSYLLRSLDFNDAYVKGFIKQFHATLAFAKVTKGDIIPGVDSEPEDLGDDDVESLIDQTKHVKDEKQKQLPLVAPGLKDFPLYTASHKGGLYVPAKMSKKDFSLLKQQIDSYLLVIAATSVAEDEQESE